MTLTSASRWQRREAALTVGDWWFDPTGTPGGIRSIRHKGLVPPVGSIPTCLGFRVVGNLPTTPTTQWRRHTITASQEFDRAGPADRMGTERSAMLR